MTQLTLTLAYFVLTHCSVSGPVRVLSFGKNVEAVKSITALLVTILPVSEATLLLVPCHNSRMLLCDYLITIDTIDLISPDLPVPRPIRLVKTPPQTPKTVL